jgi:signal transduction histidine kinase
MMESSKQPAKSTKFSEYASDINDAGQDLLYLINNILDFSRIEAGKDELHEGYFEIRGLARSVFSLVDEDASEGGITLEPELANDLPLLFADESKLKKILVVLVSNAIKFTEPGGTVTLKVWSTADSGYVFQVIDTGIGIALKDIPKALSRFSQVDGDLDRKYGGAGLGLPLAKALVEVQGGSMDLQSKLGVGTTVTVRFPFLRVKKALHDVESPDIENRRAS